MKLKVKRPNPTNPPQDSFEKFGNWTGQTDSKVIAKDLQNRGLIGADQLVNENQNTSSADAVRSNQSAWKIAAMQQIVANARRFGIKTPEAVNANRNALMSTLDPKYKDAINSPSFSTVHPNFWGVISNSILPEQYAKEANAMSTAKN